MSFTDSGYRQYAYRYDLNYCNFVREEIGELTISKSNSYVRHFSIMDLTDVNLLLGYSSNTNQIYYTLLSKLNELRNDSEGKEKLYISDLLVQFIAKVFYSGIDSFTEDPSLMYSIMYLVDKDIIKDISDSVTFALIDRRYGSSCFRELTGWQHGLDIEEDRKVNQYIFNILYDCMLDEKFIITKDFYVAVGKVLDAYKLNHFYSEAGKNLIRFLDYIENVKRIEGKDSLRFSEEEIQLWKTNFGKFLFYSTFSQEHEIRRNLVKYGVLKPSNHIGFYDFREILKDLLKNEDYNYVKNWYKARVSESSSMHVDRIYYEPIIFQSGKDAVLQVLKKVKTDVFQLPKSNRFPARDAARRRVLLEGYRDYKTKEEFVTLVKEILEDLIKDACTGIGSLGSFREKVELIVATKECALIRTYILRVKDFSDENAKKVILSYDLIQKFVRPEEILQDNIIKSIVRLLEDCIQFYNLFKGSINREKLYNMIIKNLDKKELDAFVGREGFYYAETDIYRGLQEATGGEIDKIFQERYPHIIKARDLYRSKYKVMIE